MSSQRWAGKLGVLSLTMAQVCEPGARSPQSLLTSLSHEARADLSLLSVAGSASSAASHVDGVSRSIAVLACMHAADLSPPAPVHSFSCQVPHGPAFTPAL